ncbi:MAG: MBL fold metallo-hydrolase [Candidatus Heimdallarchaeota archaeon]
MDGWRVDEFHNRHRAAKPLAFLTHAHRDHTRGLSAFLKRARDITLVCSQETAKIIEVLDGVPPERCLIVRPGEELSLDTGSATVLDANHCIGSLMFHFDLKDVRTVITGDFRANDDILEEASAFSEPDICYIDATFDQPTFNFPSQAKAITEALKIAMQVEKSGKELLLGSYLIGKEQLFATISHAIQDKVFLANPTQQEIYSALDLKPFWTDDIDDTWISVVPMSALQKPKKLQQRGIIRSEESHHQIIASGWACLHQSSSNVSYVPYSEHNDYGELANYRSMLKAKKEIKIA